jgi:predicted metal-dependent phosphoesterase TrpH
MQPELEVDLHIHTEYSDSTLTVEEVVKRAEEMGLGGVGITDHDTVDGLPSLIRLCEKRGMLAVPGVELSAVLDDTDIHVLGYFIRHDNREFNRRLRQFQEARVDRAREMVDRLIGMGVLLDFESIEELSGRGTIGRPHIAIALLRKGAVHSFEEAFARYIGYHAPAYVPKFRLHPADAVSMIKRVGGFPVLPHPGVLGDDDLVAKVIRMGMMGIEAWHPHHSDEEAERYLELARQYDLVATAGSDCHGALDGPSSIGGRTVGIETVYEMKGRLTGDGSISSGRVF